MRTLTPLFHLTALALALSACNFKEEKIKVAGDENLPTIEDSELNYANVRTKVLSPYCLTCHSSAGGNQGGLNLDTYSRVTANLAGIAEVVFVEKSMPPTGGLPTQPYALLKAWIEKDAPETAP